ncbi:uncharacterized protein LOC115744326 [Rhodamnia argentea]|uniref:Uncharacterized protein LOC115744326 n=1 Tax=Rhodamnia argentea TaxID=178133 RepID=A0A8B8PKG9_9MYRT|nr:uncharacterized protein LOC115744326 [Rhodamnia argentea]XP_030535300.2 uncharacterized protein LOC115744326 [Rhodamnia argentea]
MEAGPARGNGDADLREHPPSALGGDDPTFEIKRLYSSSSSESSSADSIELAVKGNSASDAGSHGHLTHDDGHESVPRHGGGGGDIPVSSMPKIESSESGSSDSVHDLSSNNGSAKQLPPIQVMERTGDVTGSPSPYRIPSSVFARTKSTAPMEWSTASNESLFSIQMGNASFTRDQIYWVGKSQELSMYGAPPIPPVPMDYASPTPVNKSTEIGLSTTNVGERQSAPTPAAHPPEDPKESVNHSKETFPWPEVTYSSSPSHHSDASGASVKSFAFPILSRDAARSGSLRVGPNGMKPLTSFVQAKSEPQAPKPPPPKAASGMGQARWFSCFPCWSICSSG